MQIREFDAARDAAFIRHCVIEIQEIERSIDPRLPSGRAMADAYCRTLLERCARAGRAAGDARGASRGHDGAGATRLPGWFPGSVLGAPRCIRRARSS